MDVQYSCEKLDDGTVAFATLRDRTARGFPAPPPATYQYNNYRRLATTAEFGAAVVPNNHSIWTRRRANISRHFRHPVPPGDPSDETRTNDWNSCGPAAWIKQFPARRSVNWCAPGRRRRESTVGAQRDAVATWRNARWWRNSRSRSVNTRKVQWRDLLSFVRAEEITTFFFFFFLI